MEAVYFPSRNKLVMIALAAALGLAGCSRSSTAVHVTPEKERRTAPDFTLKDATGAPLKLSDLRGKVVLLNFWATWCGPCEVEIPWFVDFQKAYRDRDFAVLGVSMDDDGWKSVRPYLQEHKINYRIVIGDDHLSELYGGVDSLPTSFVIDRDGRIAAMHVGLVSKSDYQNEIVNLLGAPKMGELIHSHAVPGDLAALLRANRRPLVR